MSDLAQRQRRIGRIAAAVLMAFAVFYGTFGLMIEYSFSSDPIGPRGFPAGLAVALFALGAWYWLVPGSTEEWPEQEGRIAALTFLVVSAACVLAMDWIGFVPAMLVLMTVIARLFGANWTLALVNGAGQALLWWLMFGPLLGGTLPKGPLGF
ncbi:tripartite tricarboxylate transporter TctB family protein [Rhabdaerophilum sp. SD176]|uniref:tripartite tricarboxylate transporter TctB family protein n=1 Tax=Rhabdaerophilum sp. SD176 TaxID=2983548 RepID=UPI0024DF7F84|nr:tripartite tricarboxylate transporter TctB family protein [Rhabdaerophilum sp. SD176]